MDEFIGRKTREEFLSRISWPFDIIDLIRFDPKFCVKYFNETHAISDICQIISNWLRIRRPVCDAHLP